MTTPVIEAVELSKVFRDFWRRPKVRALNGISFTVQPGEVFGLLGPNGSGKTTTLKLVLGLLQPTSGRLRVFGCAPRDVRIKRRIGYLPEESYCYPYLTAQETLAFYGRLFDLPGRMRRERIRQLLDMIGLTHARDRVVGEFSKGMTRRIGLAQALLNDPDLILLDEPTAGLDPLGCRQVKDLIRALAARGKTVVLSSHLLADVEDVCDRIAILYNGRIQAHGPIRELLEERNQYQLTLPALPPAALQRVLAAVRAELGSEPVCEHPRRDLEQFFLSVIAQARQATAEASGVGPTAGVAQYLAPTSVLESLVAPPQPAAAAPATAPAPATAAPPADAAAQRAAEEKLRKLVKPPTATS